MDPAIVLLGFVFVYFPVLMGVIYFDPVGWFDADGTRSRATPEERVLDEDTYRNAYQDD